MNKNHYHEDEDGILRKCYHSTRTNWKAWILAGFIALVAYPVEHYIWGQIPPFNTIANYLGIGLEHKEEEHG
jgi:hypothetical protein